MANLNINISALEKLLDYVASGIGAIAGPMLAPWKARREGDAKRISAQADSDVRMIGAWADASSLQIIANAQSEARKRLDIPIESMQGTLEIRNDTIAQRIEFQERKRLSNIASVVRDAAIQLEGKEVSDHEIDPDWTARFFDCVQDVSSEDMQKIWAKILSGEVEHPGRTSLRTLDILKNMTQKDAQMFRRACNFVMSDFIFLNQNNTDDPNPIKYGNLLHLQDCNLLITGSFLSQKFCFTHDKKEFMIICNDTILKIHNTKNDIYTLSIPCAVLSIAGKELFPIIESALGMDYLQSFAKFLYSKGDRFTLSYATIIEKYSNGRVLPTDFLPIKPAAEVG